MAQGLDFFVLKQSNQSISQPTLSLRFLTPPTQNTERKKRNKETENQPTNQKHQLLKRSRTFTQAVLHWIFSWWLTLGMPNIKIWSINFKFSKLSVIYFFYYYYYLWGVSTSVLLVYFLPSEMVDRCTHLKLPGFDIYGVITPDICKWPLYLPLPHILHNISELSELHYFYFHRIWTHWSETQQAVLPWAVLAYFMNLFVKSWLRKWREIACHQIVIHPIP